MKLSKLKNIYASQKGMSQFRSFTEWHLDQSHFDCFTVARCGGCEICGIIKGGTLCGLQLKHERLQDFFGQQVKTRFGQQKC